ncbi:PucR family transcriptional regulator [Gordonia sp. VNK21]|uniref:PucR family transcriptional regulator n=1 Tax=Gordonia sp. VNK21 TaxID=3382483 RepID=UPI0038D441B8
MAVDDSPAPAVWEPVRHQLQIAADTTGTRIWLVLDGLALAHTTDPDITQLRKIMVHGRTPAGARTDAAALLIPVPQTGSVLAIANPDRHRLPVRAFTELAEQVDALAEPVIAARESRAGLEAVLISELISATRDSATLDPWTRSFGLAPGQRVKVIAARAETGSSTTEDAGDAHQQAIVRALRDLGSVYSGPTVAGLHNHTVYAMIGLAATETGPSDVFAESVETMLEVFTHRHGAPFVLGSGTTMMTGPGDLAQGLINSRSLLERQLRAVPATENDDALPPSLAGTLLADDPGQTQTLVRSLLEPIIDYDSRHDSDYLKTLRCFLLHDGAIRATADDLGIHINTLRYRIDRIERLTLRGLSRIPDRADYYLALYLYESPRRSERSDHHG